MASELFSTVWDLPKHMRAAVESRFYLSSATIDNASPWTGQRSPADPHAQFFIAEISPPPAQSADKARAGAVTWREWQGFITRLRGTSGLLRIVDYYRQRPIYEEKHAKTLLNWSDGATWVDGSKWSRGALPPFVTLDAAARFEDDSIVLRGLPSDTELVLQPSDLIELRPNGTATNYGNLYEVVHAARTNADGKTRVYLQPGLRQDFAAGDMAVLRYPGCVFRLADRDQGIVTRSIGNVGRLGLKLVEELRSA